MGSQEVIDVLERFAKPMSRGEIAKVSGINEIRVSHIIKRLIKYDEVKIIEIDRHQAMKLYRCKRRLRLYYV